MAATLTAYAIAQGYTLDLLVSGIPYTSGVDYIAAGAMGVTRQAGAGFLLTASLADPPRASFQNYRFSTRALGQNASAATKTAFPGTASTFGLSMICSNGVIYTQGSQATLTVPTLWQSADDGVTHSVAYTYAGDMAKMCADPAANALYSVAFSNATVYKVDLATGTRTVVSSQSGKFGLGIALSYGRTSLYLARYTGIDIIRLSDGAITGSIPAIAGTPGYYDVMPMTGGKGGKLLVVGRFTSTLYEVPTNGIGTHQPILTGCTDFGRIHIFQNNQVAVAETSRVYLLTVPTGSGVSQGSCYDSNLGGDGGGNDGTGGGGDGGVGGPDAGGGGCDCCSWQTPARPTSNYTTPTRPVSSWRKPECPC